MKKTVMGKRINDIIKELKRLYPDAGPALVFSNPYELLMATMLSAQCTDRQVNRVTPAVFLKYPNVQAMADADADELHVLVKSCGFRSKADHMIGACRIIEKRYGGEVPRSLKELTELPGVGRKTANVVLANAFNIPAFAVDTHVFRVCHRLGLSDGKTPEKTEEQMTAQLPKADWGKAHHMFIAHGRQVCRAQNPGCAGCTLRGFCEYVKQKSD